MLYILPGMATNNRMYEGPWRELPNTRFLDWPKLHGDPTLTGIAQRVIEENSIQPEDWIGGTSLGGMVSLEISKLLGNPQVILMGSARHPKEVAPLLMKLTKFSHLTPVTFLQMISGSTPLRFGQVFINSDPAFIRRAGWALRSWEGGEASNANILRIHGSRDIIIPCPNEGHIIEGAGHLVSMSNPEKCVELVREAMESSSDFR